MTPATPPAPAADAVPMVEMVVQPARRAAFGFRIFPDGRHEALSDFAIDTDAARRPVLREMDLAWRAQPSLAPEQVAALQAAIRQTGVLALDPAYGEPGRVDDASVARWRFELDGVRREVVVQGSQFVEVPALEALYQRFEALRARGPANHERWRVRASGHLVERDVRCGPHDVPALSEVLRRVYATSGHVPGGGEAVRGTDPGTALLEMLYLEAGVVVTRILLYPDGRLTEIDAGAPGETLLRTLDAASVAGVREALAGFAALPDPICGP